ncbi:MAG: aldo/keto reductase [Rhodospirillales bacterium]|nr:aldo/keto reductase [Rhodospirillales bacterium]
MQSGFTHEACHPASGDSIVASNALGCALPDGDQIMEFRTFGESGLYVSLAGMGCNTLELAIGWLASHEVVSTVICGATRPKQAKANAAAVTAWPMTPDEINDISDIVGR